MNSKKLNTMKLTFKKSPKSPHLHHFPLFTFHFSLFTFHYSLFTFHYSLFTFNFSLPPLFTFHFSLIAFFTFSFPLLTAAQPQDSLYAVWQDETQADSVRVDAYKDYIWNGFLFSKPDSALVLAEALHRYAKNHNYPNAAILGYRLQGIATSIQSNFSSSLEYFEKGLAVNEELKDEKGIAVSLGNIGIIYHKQGNFPRALEYYEKSLAIQEKLGDNPGISNNLLHLGGIYYNQGNFPRALEYYEKSLAINEKFGNKQHLATILNNIGNVYLNQENYSRALENYEKSLAIMEEFEDKGGIALSFNNIGNIYSAQGNNPRALEYYQKSLAIREELGDKRGITISLNNIGDIYRNQGYYPLALVNCHRSLALAEEIGALVQQNFALTCLYNTYKAMGSSNEALVYLEKLNVIKDSLQAEETGKKLQQMEFVRVMLQDSIAKAEEARLVQKSHREEVRKQRRTRNMAIAGGAFFLLLSGGYYSRWRYVRKSRNIIAKERDRSENLLLNILPAEIAEELKAKGRADARDYEMVSILFTDFKSFTETSANLSAAELVHEINACFEAFDSIIEKYGIEKIKTIGDSYMAAGGLPVPTDDSVKNTILVALKMQEFIQKRKTENETAGKPAFEMRVGIHTGPVVAGIVGVKKFQYDVWGDTVNTASRMENRGEVGKVNISQGTYELIKEDPQFRFESRGKIEAKGKGEVEMYFVSKM